MKTRIVFGIIACTLALVSTCALAKEPPAPLGITPTPTPGTDLSVNLWTNKSNYTVGESLVVYYTVNRPAYIYLYDIQPDGVVRLVFPNAYSHDNFVRAGTHILPDKASYTFLVTPPTGLEQLQIFASLAPLPLSGSSSGDPFPMLAPDPDSATEELRGRMMGIVPSPGWATAWTSFTISAPSYPPSGYYPGHPYPPYPTPPFFGWPYSGGYWYWEDGEWHYGVPGSGWYWYLGPDGRWRFSIHIHFGSGGS